jgi:hypothetical protein
MRRLFRGFFDLVGAAAVLGMVAACGAGSTSSGSGSSGQVSAAAPVKSSVPAAGGDAHRFCAVVERELATLRGTEVTGLLAGGSPSAWKAYLDRVTAMNQQLVDAAPAEVKASVETLQATTMTMKATFAAAGYDVTKVGGAKVIKLLQAKDRQDASAALTAYVSTRCGIDLTKVGG